MPRVAIKTGFVAPNGTEEELTEYLCDWPQCPNVATQVLGCIRESGLSAVVCDEHAAGTGPSDTARTNEADVSPPDCG
jgi:hypothetical protein